VLTIDAAQRRARLGIRHGLARRFGGGHDEPVVEVADRLIGLHATDPATPFLSARARIAGFTADHLEDALYGTESLTKHLCMRRTLFVVSRAHLPIVQAACTRAVVARERKRIAADIEKGGVAADGARWLRRAEDATVEALAAMRTATGAQLSKAVPDLQVKLVYAEGKAWGGEVGVTTRVLTVLAAEARIRRGRPNGWTSSRHQWEIVDEPPPERSVVDATRDLVSVWLRSFGPATPADVAWWTGLGLTPVRTAIAALDTVPVDLDGDAGVVLADDTEPVPAPEPWAAFLPALDPTTMGWKARDWYLGELGPALFDRSGNAGPTVWWDGRVVGGWGQRATGEVAYRLLDETLGAEARDRIAAEAAAVEAWLAGTVVTPRFRTPLERELRG
jgi:hypothetical protein